MDNIHYATDEYEPMTNADRIRAMSDEKLAFFLAEWNENQRAWRRDSEGALLYWLREPAKNAEGVLKTKRYNIYYRKYNIIANDYIAFIKIVHTDDIYHEIGKMICTSMEKIESISYTEPRASQEVLEKLWVGEGYRKLSDDIWIADEKRVTTADTCVCCGAIIPEGQMVCPNCLVTIKEDN